MAGASARHVSQKGDQNQNIKGLSPLTTDRRLTSAPVAASNISMSGTSSEISVVVVAAVVVVAGTSVVVTGGSVVVVVVVSAAAVVVVDGSVVAAVSTEVAAVVVDEVVADVVEVASGPVVPVVVSGCPGGGGHGRRRIGLGGGRAVRSGFAVDGSACIRGCRSGGRTGGVATAGHDRACNQRHG